MILEPLDAEQFLANGVLTVPKRRWTSAFKGSARENFHLTFLPRNCAGEFMKAEFTLRLPRPIVPSAG
jgi:hypothetical protein